MPMRRPRLILRGKQSRNPMQPLWQPLFSFRASCASSLERSSLLFFTRNTDVAEGVAHGVSECTP